MLRLPIYTQNIMTSAIGFFHHIWYRFFVEVVDILNQIFPTQDTSEHRIVWDDLRFPMTGVNPPGLVSDPTYDDTNIGLVFSGSADNRIDIIGQLPHKVRAGSNIKPHLHWLAQSNSAGNVIWQLKYKWYDNFEPEPASFTYVNINTVVTANANFANATISGFGNTVAPATGGVESSIFKASILRLGSADSYSGPALLNEFDIHFQVEKLGSATEIPLT